MKQRILFFQVVGVFMLGLALVAPKNVFAAKYGAAGCGLGSLIFEDNPGKVQQIVAGIVNNWFFPASFAITTGTSNCTAEAGSDTASLFIAVNREALEKDASRGEGETLAHLSQVMGCKDSLAFGEAMQKNYGAVFADPSLPSKEVKKSIQGVVQSDEKLSATCAI